MVKRIGGFRRKTRHKLRKAARSRSKLSISKYFQDFEVGDKAVLSTEPSISKGVFFPRFYGKIGTVKEKIGACYRVLIKDHNKEKSIIVHPVHLKKV